MDYRNYLAQRIFPNFTDVVVAYIEQHPDDFRLLYDLIYDDDITIAWRAAWCCEKVFEKHPEMLSDKTDELINLVMRQTHSGMRRILLSVLLNMPLPEQFPVAFMDFCYERILDRNEKVAVQSLCIKIVYKLCLLEPALFSELQAVLESIELYYSSPAIKRAQSQNPVEIKNSIFVKKEKDVQRIIPLRIARRTIWRF